MNSETAKGAGVKLLLRHKEVCQAVGLGKRTLYRKIAAGEFPKADAYLGTAPVWRLDTIEHWVDELTNR